MTEQEWKAFYQQAVQEVKPIKYIIDTFWQQFFIDNTPQIVRWESPLQIKRAIFHEVDGCWIGKIITPLTLGGKQAKDAENNKQADVLNFPTADGGQMYAHDHSILLIMSLPSWLPVTNANLQQFQQDYILPAFKNQFDIQCSERNDLIYDGGKAAGALFLPTQNNRNAYGMIMNLDGILPDDLDQHHQGKTATRPPTSIPLDRDIFIQNWCEWIEKVKNKIYLS